MQKRDANKAARTVALELGIVDERDEAHEEQLNELVEDERFAASAFLFSEAETYLGHENSVDVDRDAYETLRKSVKMHGARMLTRMAVEEDEA